MMVKVVLWTLAAVCGFAPLAFAAGDPAFEKGWREPALSPLGSSWDKNNRRTYRGRIDWCVEADWEDPARQVQACTRDIEERPPDDAFDLATRYYNRGNGYFDLKRYDKAFSDYYKAIELKDGIPYFYNNRGLVSYLNGEYAAAVSDFDHRIKIEFAGVYLKSYINRGDAYFKMGKYREAIASYSAALKEEPSSFLSSTYSGHVGYKRDARQADADCRTAIAGAYYKRGLAYRKRGELDKAVRDTEKSLEIMRATTSVCAEKEN